mmetsp:Transcript_25606/g.70462  ORF Transcript_25606/g.70462 Transcript_25606/m.70462 type:complete len:130 (+) Transcript_25606:4411-4800(+)
MASDRVLGMGISTWRAVQISPPLPIAKLSILSPLGPPVVLRVRDRLMGRLGRDSYWALIAGVVLRCVALRCALLGSPLLGTTRIGVAVATKLVESLPECYLCHSDRTLRRKDTSLGWIKGFVWKVWSRV